MQVPNARTILTVRTMARVQSPGLAVRFLPTTC
jgi:hypothetical protein